MMSFADVLGDTRASPVVTCRMELTRLQLSGAVPPLWYYNILPVFFLSSSLEAMEVLVYCLGDDVMRLAGCNDKYHNYI